MGLISGSVKSAVGSVAVGAESGVFGTQAFILGAGSNWGCTGIVVFTNVGAWTARMWEYPSFLSSWKTFNYSSADDFWSRTVLDQLQNGITIDVGAPASASPR